MMELPSWVRLVKWMHPDIADLLLWIEGKPNRRIDQHILRCETCRKHAEILRVAGQASGSAENVLPILAEIGVRLRHSMRARTVSEGSLVEDESLRNRQSNVVSALEFYFGKEAAHSVGNSAQETEPLFSAFLGRKAAAVLTSRMASAASI